jgi:His-Xaa-Ser system radical SAM maturase HxsC
MIDLQIPIECDADIGPFVCRVEKPGKFTFGKDGLRLLDNDGGYASGIINGVKIDFPFILPEELVGDILLILPKRGSATRLIRHKSRHNTLLFTEQCDQLCVMCSQPPKRINDKWRIPFYMDAIRLADPGIQIGISGGEPTLQHELFFELLEDISDSRPDLKLHILTNAQHFNDDDIKRLKRVHDQSEILWGVPLYAADSNTHDRIVFKEGAFETLIPNIYRLASSKGRIELRTVLTGMNYPNLPKLANFISKNLFFINVWAIMGLEPTGFAKAFKSELFVDHSALFEPLEHVLDITKARNLPTILYNIPLCTVPEKYRCYCADSISDWKKKFIPECTNCAKRSSCSGFFEWYTDSWKYSGVHSLS